MTLLYRHRRVAACTCASEDCPAHVGRRVILRDYARQVPQYFTNVPAVVVAVSGWNSGNPRALVEWQTERHHPIRGSTPITRRHRVSIRALRVIHDGEETTS